MSASLSIPERVRRFNLGRNKEHLALKYRALRESAFRFFRGTDHIYFEDWPKDAAINSAPAVWSCGDLHLENFGSFKGDSRMVYFDMNDFDEAVLAPATWDTTRFLSSVRLACREMKIDDPVTEQLSLAYIVSYAGTLEEGHARLIEAGTAAGIVRDFLDSLQTRKRRAFLDKRTELKKSGRRLIIDGVKTEALDDRTRGRIGEMLKAFGETQADPKFYRLLDAAKRIAGTGSLGLERNVLLVEGQGSPHKNYLLDMKFQPGSAVQGFSPCIQPSWPSESHRVVGIQRRMQGIPQALLAPVEFEGRSFVLRELQPTQDRIELSGMGTRTGLLTGVLVAMGQITAWDQLRSAGRQGSAIADDLISYGASLRESIAQGKNSILDAARDLADSTSRQYRDYCWAFDDGYFNEKG